jgi:hypothetical protein
MFVKRTSTITSAQAFCFGAKNSTNPYPPLVGRVDTVVHGHVRDED